MEEKVEAKQKYEEKAKAKEDLELKNKSSANQDISEEEKLRQVEKLLKEAGAEIDAKQSPDVDRLNQVFAKLQGSRRFPELPAGIQQQLRTLAHLQEQRRLGHTGKTGFEVDHAIRVLAEDIGKKMAELQKTKPDEFDLTPQEVELLLRFDEFYMQSSKPQENQPSRTKPQTMDIG